MKTFLAELFMCSLVLHIPKVRIPIAACFLLTQLVAVQIFKDVQVKKDNGKMKFSN